MGCNLLLVASQQTLLCYTQTMSQARKKEAYLGKRELKRAASKGIKEASIQAMEVAGSVLTVENGWLVRRYKDSRVEKIEKLPSAKKSNLKALAND